MHRRIYGIAILLICLLIPGAPVWGKYTGEHNYIYDYWGSPNHSVAAFELYKVIDRKTMGSIALGSLDDVFCTEDSIYLVDTVSSRVHVLDDKLNLLKSIKVIRNQNHKIVVDDQTNQQLILKNPEGVFVQKESNELYIADTGGERIIVLDADGYYLKRIIKRPDNMIGTTVFRPSKIVVDPSNRMYVVVQSGSEGILELNEDGSFSRYFGVNKPKVNLIDYFWKNLASEEQKKKMKKTYAPSFNNVDIDHEGFIYSTTFDKAALNMVFRLNPKGKNILRETGYVQVKGDVHPVIENEFIDIAVNDFGVYAVLDKETGRIFIYNFDGDLINIFNEKGNMLGNVKEPTGIAWFNDYLIVSDKYLKCAFVFMPTRSGELALKGAEAYYRGEWEEAGRYYRKVIEMNSNYDIAYVGLGKNLLMQDQYKEAMYYLRLGNNQTYYSKAFNGYRNEILRKYFPLFFIGFLTLAFLIIKSEVAFHKREG